ncbi:EKC/KEOPS complex subunit Tp53rkb-like [Watersipora subatra]|uniref:EKC/KEOPS complex subunit Tp53rkb-like n=1 Tax=Watersipora subatra TaxID=2589382 RepID=UPI00355BBD6C
MDFRKQGAEARLYVTSFLGRRCLVKERFKKLYRHADLERSLTSQRMKSEIQALVKCRQCGIATPALYYVDKKANAIYMEYLDDCITLKDHVNKLLLDDCAEPIVKIANQIGSIVAKLHDNGIIHGDLTTSNLLVRNAGSPNQELVLIDFGLTSLNSSNYAEDKGVDLYVLERAFLSTHPKTEELFASILKSYEQSCRKGSCEAIAKLEEVRLRGRKRTMVG